LPFVSLTSGTDTTTDRIDAHLRISLSKYKVPAEITILDDSPKTAVGKLDKPSLSKSLQT
jgi:long-chain acyl-CoA synthetase